MSSGLGFSVNNSPLNVSVTQYNPLSNVTPSGSWNYYYHICSTNSEIIEINNPNNLSLNLCIFAQGGNGGKLGYISGSPPQGYKVNAAIGGGGGGGQVINMTNMTSQNFSIVLQPTGIFQPCQLITNTGEPGTTSSTIFIAQGATGGVGQPITAYSDSGSKVGSGGQGGSGGTGGGAAGNAGQGGSVYYNGSSSVPQTTYSYTGPGGLLGEGNYPENYGNFYNNTPNTTPVTFADGTSAKIAGAGKQTQSGNAAGFLIYYQVLGPMPLPPLPPLPPQF